MCGACSNDTVGVIIFVFAGGSSRPLVSKSQVDGKWAQSSETACLPWPQRPAEERERCSSMALCKALFNCEWAEVLSRMTDTV